PPRSAALRRGGAALLAASASLLIPLATAAPALAAPGPASPSASASPGASHGATAPDGKAKPPNKPAKEPPAQMSTVGGELLGKPGTQVQLGPGAPQLPKEISGDSWLVADAESGDILAAHNLHWKRPPASTLKMLFADTVLPKFPKDQKHKVLASDLAGMGEGSSQVGIKEDSTYTVHDLWLG